MYTQEEKDKMAMKNATIDKFSKKDPCPEGMVPDGRGGCVSKKVINLPEITVKPSKSQIKSYTTKTNAEADSLNKDSNVKGTLNLEVRNGWEPTNTRLKQISSWTSEPKGSTGLLDYGNPADKPKLNKISTSRANLEKAKKNNAYENKVYNKNRKKYLEYGTD
jgi:hypothetical protein